MRHGKHVWLVVKGWGSETLFFAEDDARSWHESNAAGYPEGTPSQLIRYTRDDAELVDARLAALEAERDALRADAERYRWLCADHAGVERHLRNSLLERMAVMSQSAVNAAIDAAKGGA